MSSTCCNIIKILGILPLSKSILPIDPYDTNKCNKYIRNLLPIHIQFKAMRKYSKQYIDPYIPEEIFIEIEEMLGEMEENEQIHFLNNYYNQFIIKELQRIYWLPHILGWIQMWIIICYSIAFLFFLSPFHIISPMQKLFNFIYGLSWMLLIVVTLQIIGIILQILMLNKNKIYRIRYLFKLSMTDNKSSDFHIPIMKWCNSLKCDNCSKLRHIYLILLEKYGLLYFISIVLILSNNYHSIINTHFLKILSMLKMESLYYTMYTESNQEDHEFFFMYILFWFFHLFVLPFGSLFNAFPKRKMLSLSFRYIIIMIFGLMTFLFICYVWYYKQLLMPLVYANISWLYCIGFVSLFCAGKCIRKYIYYGYYSSHDGDGKEYLKLALQHLGCVYIMDALFLSIAGFAVKYPVMRYCIYLILHLLSILTSYLYYLQIQIRLQYKQNGDCFTVDLGTYCCGWLVTYHQDIDWLIDSQLSCTDSSIVSFHDHVHNVSLNHS